MPTKSAVKQINEKAEFELKDQNQKTVSNVELANSNQKYILAFYPKANTPGCSAEMCSLTTARSQLNDLGYKVYGVSLDSPQQQQDWIDAKKLNVDGLLCDVDGEVSKKFGVYGEKNAFGRKTIGINRTTFVVDAAGNIEHVITKVNTKNHGKQLIELICPELKQSRATAPKSKEPRASAIDEANVIDRPRRSARSTPIHVDSETENEDDEDESEEEDDEEQKKMAKRTSKEKKPAAPRKSRKATISEEAEATTSATTTNDSHMDDEDVPGPVEGSPVELPAPVAEVPVEQPAPVVEAAPPTQMEQPAPIAEVPVVEPAPILSQPVSSPVVEAAPAPISVEAAPVTGTSVSIPQPALASQPDAMM